MKVEETSELRNRDVWTPADLRREDAIWSLELRALLRWADDGGRWVDECETARREVRI